MMPNLKILLHLVLLQVVCHFNVIVNGEWAGQVIQSQVTQVNPFKGLMTYYDADCEELTYGECYRGASPKPMPKDKAMAVEFFELPYQRVVNETKGLYNWTFFDRILKEISSRKRHAVVRFWDTYPGKKPGVPTYIRESKNYKELHLYNKEEGTWINYTDWSSREWRSFHTEFYKKFQARYENDRRIFVIQVGFGHWAEYHIYGMKYEFGKNFPSYAYQTKFLTWMNKSFTQTPWQISVDAADAEFLPSPLFLNETLMKMNFGCFMDSINAPVPDLMQNNFKSWALRYEDRMRIAPLGGELCYDQPRCQPYSLSRQGPYGVPLEIVIRKTHLTTANAAESLREKYNVEFGTLQAKKDRFKEVSMLMGYNFKIEAYHYDASAKRAHVLVNNTGVAPSYFDMYITVDGVRSTQSLKRLQPGSALSVYVENVSQPGKITIECDRLVPGQVIQFDADTTGTELYRDVQPDETESIYQYFTLTV